MASNSPVDAPDGTAARPRGARAQRDVDLDRRVAPRVEDLAGVDGLDLATCWAAPGRTGCDRSRRAGPGRSSPAGDSGRRSSQAAPSRAARSAAACTRPRKRSLGRAQRELGIDLELARDVDRREQDVADLVEALGLRARGLELVELAADALVRDVGEVEAGRGRAALDLARVERPGQVLGDLAEDPRLAARLGGLDRVPVAQDLAGRLGLRVAAVRRSTSRDPGRCAGGAG